MNEEVISKEKLEERYKKVIVRTEETVTPFGGKTEKRYVIDLIHEGNRQENEKDWRNRQNSTIRKCAQIHAKARCKSQPGIR